MYTVIYRYNGKQVHIYSYLEKYWETDARIQLFRKTLGNKYTYAVIYRCNKKQVHVYSHLEKQEKAGTCILLFRYTMRNRHTYSVISRYIGSGPIHYYIITINNFFSHI